MSVHGFKKLKYIFISLFVMVSVTLMITRHMTLVWLVGAYAVIFLVMTAVYYSSLLGLLGNYYLARGHSQKAEEVYRYAIQRSTKNVTIYLNYAILLIRRGNMEEALSLLRWAAGLKPKRLTAQNIALTMGGCYGAMGRFDDAISVLEEMLGRYGSKNSHMLATLGYMYLMKEEYEKAWEFSNKAVMRNPKSGAAWDNLGQISYRQGNLKEAREAFLKAVSNKKGMADSYYYLGLIAEAENEPELAREYFYQADDCTVNALNTITKEQIKQKLQPKG